MFALGAAVAFGANVVGGATGFGAALLSTPFLFLIGFRPEFVVTANLTLALITRISVVYRFRSYVTPRRAGMLILGSIPGLYVGALTLTTVSASTIKTATGVLVILIAIVLIRSNRAPAPPPIPAGPAIAGFAGGFLGTTTSLSGVPPALLLTRERIAPLNFLVDLATYFVVSNGLALVVLYVEDALVPAALFPAAALWLPGALVGNILGIALGRRLPVHVFRRIILAVIFVAGITTVLAS